jgi:hypothetical protein
MAKAVIEPGNCGFTTIVEATPDGDGRVRIKVESQCKAIQKLAENLREVDPLQEMSLRRGEGPRTLNLGRQYCSHAACPVPVGIIKAVEIAAGVALPAEVSIKLTKE